MENTIINVEGNVGMSTQNPSERLHVHCITTDADYNMENRMTNGEGNVSLACKNPSERLHVPCITTDADYKHAFGVPQHIQDAIKLEINENTKVGMEFDPNQEFFIFQDGNIGIGTPHASTELNIYKK